MTDEERHQINFDHPDAFDWKLLHKQVHELREGHAIEQPTYSYLKCNRLPETIRVEPKPVIIIEGIMTLLNKKLRNLMDLKKLVDCDPDKRLIRKHSTQHDRPWTNGFHGCRPLFGSIETHARAIYRADEALCRPHYSTRRREYQGYRHSLQVYRGPRSYGVSRQ